MRVRRTGRPGPQPPAGGHINLPCESSATSRTIGKHAVSPSSVPGYVGRLRSRIGQDPIRSSAGYCSIIDETEVDAFVLENMIKQYDVCEIADIDDVDSDFSDRYENLLDLHAMWQANPALHFADAHEDEFFTTVYLEFERYWDCLKRCIIYSGLRSRRKPRIEKAMGRIRQLLAQDPSDEQLSALLYRAQASLPAHDGPAARGDIVVHAGPHRLLALCIAVITLAACAHVGRPACVTSPPGLWYLCCSQPGSRTFWVDTWLRPASSQLGTASSCCGITARRQLPTA